MCKPLRLFSVVLLTALPAWSLIVAAVGAHQFDGFVVTVVPDATSVLSEADYQVTVETEELLVSRLTAAYDGTLSNSFVADLNGDGEFEVVVTFSHPDGHESDIHVYSWKEYLLQPLAVSELDDAQRLGYRGNDEFAVQDGRLIRMFQVYEQSGGGWSPTADRRRLHYSFEQARWTAQ